MLAARGSLVGILVEKSHHYESPLCVFPQLVLAYRRQTNMPDCTEGKSQLPKDTVHVFWSDELPPRSVTFVDCKSELMSFLQSCFGTHIRRNTQTIRGELLFILRRRAFTQRH